MKHDHSVELMPIIFSAAPGCHRPPFSRVSSSRTDAHVRSESIRTPSRSKMTAEIGVSRPARPDALHGDLELAALDRRPRRPPRRHRRRPWRASRPRGRPRGPARLRAARRHRPSVSAIRSVTSRPASRRAFCTAWTISRASPSRRSSSSSSSRARPRDRPAPRPGSRPAAAGRASGRRGRARARGRRR